MTAFSPEQTKEISDIIAKALVDQMATAGTTPTGNPPPPHGASSVSMPQTQSIINLWVSPDNIADMLAQQTGPAPSAVQHSPSFFLGASPSGGAAVLNPLAGNNVVLCFPHVDQAVLLLVLSHSIEFKALIKLNLRFTQQSAPEQTLQYTNGQLNVVDKAVSKAFLDMSALVGALLVYFNVLLFSLSASHGKQAGGWEHGWTLSHGASLFIQHLFQLQHAYTFLLILQYAERFFLFRRTKMLHGHFSGWWAPDNSLIFHLQILPPTAKLSGPAPASTGKGKARIDTICTNFLKGTCTGDICPWGCKHAQPTTVAVASSSKA